MNNDLFIKFNEYAYDIFNDLMYYNSIGLPHINTQYFIVPIIKEIVDNIDVLNDEQNNNIIHVIKYLIK